MLALSSPTKQSVALRWFNTLFNAAGVLTVTTTVVAR